MADQDVEYQRSVLDAVVEASDAGILVVDEDREFFTYNQRFVDMWAIPEDIVASGDDEAALASVLDTLKYPEQFLEKVEYFYDHPSESSQDRIQLTDGRVFDRYTAPVVGDGGTYFGRVWTFRDITDRIERERRLHQQKERLEEYANVVSHDLRNPLNVARGRIEMLKQTVTEDAGEHVEHVEQALQRVQTLVDELVDVARAGEDVSNPRSLDLRTVAKTSWEQVPTEDARLDVRTARSVEADPTKLQQLFENLFRNAVEHSDGEVRIWVDDTDGGYVVADDGGGFPDAPESKLLDSGYTTKADGSGLGLSIVEQVADAHDWDLSLGTSSRGGARIEILTI